MAHIRYLLLSLFIVLLFVGCSAGKAEEKIVKHLEETIVLEEAFTAEQEKINELELKDHELYEEIIKLNIEEFDQIVVLADEAIELLEERLEHLQVEKDSIDASKAEFEKIEGLIAKLSDDKKGQAEEMYTVMMERFKSYDTVYDEYNKSISLTKDLYESLKNKDVEEKEIVSLITNVNESYEAVFVANDEFNEKTESYNDLKQKFYDTLDKVNKTDEK